MPRRYVPSPVRIFSSFRKNFLSSPRFVQAGSMVDPPPTVVTTSLVHRELHVIPVRLVFYRTPRSRKHTPSPSSPIPVAPTPLIHPLNNPLCPIVCQATVLSGAECQRSNQVDSGFYPRSDQRSGHTSVQMHTGDDSGEPLLDRSSASLFGELETSRGSSWQYELQQLKFANQRLHEELHALEASSGAGAGSSSGAMGAGHASFSHPCSSSSPTVPIPIAQMPPAQMHYTPLMHLALSTSLPPLPPPNTLHEQDPPSSEWSSLAGANGRGANPLKRLWHSEDGPTT